MNKRCMLTATAIAFLVVTTLIAARFSASADVMPTTVEAQRFILVDTDGNEVGLFAYNEAAQGPVLTMHGRQTTGSITLAVVKGEPAFSLAGVDGAPNVKVVIQADGTLSATIADSEGKSDASFLSFRSGLKSLHVGNAKNGQLVYAQPPGDDAMLQLTDSLGRARVEAAASSKRGTATLRIKGEDGAVLFYAP